MSNIGLKEIAALVVFFVFVLPTLISVIDYTEKVSKNPQNSSNIEEGVDLIVDNAVPWWMDIIETLGGINGIIGAVLIILFILFLRWLGEIR